MFYFGSWLLATSAIGGVLWAAWDALGAKGTQGPAVLIGVIAVLTIAYLCVVYWDIEQTLKEKKR